MKISATLPRITKTKEQSNSIQGFPVDDYSYSSMVKLGSNPVMFRINKLNGDEIETTSKASNVLGKAGHKALQRYFGGVPDLPTAADEGEAIKQGLEYGNEYLKNYSDGFIEWTDKIASRAKLNEKFAFCYFGYLKELNKKDIKNILLIEETLKYRIEIEGKELPVPLKGIADLVYEDQKDRIVILDHKFTGQYSPEDKIDGSKLIQAAINYFLVYAHTGKKPYKIIFAEFKTSQNMKPDESGKIPPQTKRFEMVYEETPLMFELFYRLYEDVTSALMGNMVYVPNFNAIYDNEVAIMAYIHRLDQPEEREAQFKKMKVDNITDFLKKKIQKTGSMKKYLDTVSKNFVSAKTLNYSTMTTQEKIKMKLAEHGLGVEFDSKLVGASVEMYRYEPSVGLKMSKVEGYVKDIEQVLGVSGIRVLAPIPNSTMIGFEIPLKDRTFPSLPTPQGYEIAIGQDIMGGIRRFDVRTAPHILVAGASGSGKSVFLNGFIEQIATTMPELYLFDPKIVELAGYKHLAKQYETDPDKINEALEQLVIEMEERYKALATLKKKNIDGTDFKYKFVIIDEFGDIAIQNPLGRIVWTFCGKHKRFDKSGDLTKLLSTKRKLRVKEQDLVDDVAFCDKCEKHTIPPFEQNLLRLAAKGRAAGIHLVIATQSPRVEVIKGSIKANFPVKVLFKTAKQSDSLVVIDEPGAEKLLGRGDMLFVGDKGIERLQGFNL